jgi:hypothetical protein
MKILSMSLIVVLAMSTAALAAGPAVEQNEPNYEPIPVGPSAEPSDVIGVLYAQSFTLDEPYTYTWREDQPAITSGWVLVVEVTRELTWLKDTWNPVLYVGRYPAEIAGFDTELGRFVVIVPGDVDLARDPIFFGSVELPGEVSPERAEQEMQAALAAGFRPMTAEARRLLEAAGGDSVRLSEPYYLFAGPVADAIEAFAPADQGRAEGYRAPLLTKP